MKIYNRDSAQKQLQHMQMYNIYDLTSTYVKRKKVVFTNRNKLKPIAFYLPQYYPTEINNQNWGNGFTEWTNVAKAIPQYYGHYQPHIPETFGYYDLRNVNIMEEQCRLAKEYGIFGFCFYYYYFHGTTQLELPLINYVNHPNINFPFCLCWANENWTKKWDGKNQDILLQQTYTKNDMLLFISKISKYFVQDNYIKIDQRPLLIIYNAQGIPHLDEYIELWRNFCLNTGVGEIFLVCAKTFGLDDLNIINKFDACVEFPPHDIRLKNNIDYSLLTNMNFNGTIYHIQDYIKTINNINEYPLFRCAFPSWDNTARNATRAKIFSDASPVTFEMWLEKIISITIKSFPPEHRYFFINAWNEWGEGAHLEPDRKYGFAYLDILRKCLEE